METITLNLESLFEEHKGLIKSAIWRNRPLLSALRIEDEDAAQQLAIAMLSAIRRFDPNRSASLAVYISYSLQYEILNIKRRYKPQGMTGIPKNSRIDFQYLDYILPNGCVYEISCDDDRSNLEFSELSESLSEQESKAIDLRIKGYHLRNKAYTVALDNVRQRYETLYFSNTGAY